MKFYVSLKIFKIFLEEEVKDHDEPILKHLTKVTCNVSKQDDKDVYTYAFTFSQNEFFSNDVLTKKIVVSEDE